MDPSTLSGALLVYGPLGVMSMVSMFIAGKLYRDREAERDRNRAHEDKMLQEFQEERDRHKQEMEKFQERHIVKAESWMEKYWEVSKAQTAVLESFAKRQPEPGNPRPTRERTSGG